MRKCLLILVVFFAVIRIEAQDRTVDSIQLSLMRRFNIDSAIRVLAIKKDDTTKVNLLSRISYDYAFNQAEKGIYYGQKGVELSQRLGYKRGIASCNLSIAQCYWLLGSYNNGLQTALNALHLFEELNDKERIAWTYYITANVYRDFGDYNRALTDARKGTTLYESLQASATVGYAIIGSIYDLQNQLDSAILYVQKAHQLDIRNNAGTWGWLYYLFGNIHRKMKLYDSALAYYRTALLLVNRKDIIETYNGIATLYRETGNLDSSIYYASEVLQKWTEVSYQRGLLQAATILAENYRITNQRDSLIKYLDLSIALGNKLYNQQNERDIQNLSFNEQLRRDEIMQQQQQYRNQLRMNAALGISFTLMILALLLWRNNRNKQKANALLHQKNQEIQSTLSELKSAQTQLIQSEKMASLGELTAGIAHEIQNPLNFVNNFSDVNKELLEELKEEADKGNIDEVKAIADDVIGNEEKINHHGKRADAIVKGMLQHSRISTGQKEPTDINVLADEYLRISYHGLRAKDKRFNATIKTNFDASVGEINIIRQDIGRVLLNLYNNAFYAVTEKKKSPHPRQLAGGLEYEPTVSISTKLLNSPPAGGDGGKKVDIRVKDNGNGIPQKVLDKIFQPFFTTKPTGQGTGLGLSLSYDIIKAHGGEIKVETNEGAGSEFIVSLPI